MKGKIILSLVLLLFIVQAVSAIETKVNIKTIPGDTVQITFSDSSSASFSALEGGMFNGISDEYGDFNFVFTSEKEEFNIIIYVKDPEGNKRVPVEKITKHPAGETLLLRLAPDWFDFIENPISEIVNDTNVTEENLTEEGEEIIPEEEIVEIFDETNDQSSGITGAVIFGEGGILSGKTLYYVGGILVILIASLGTLKIIKHKRTKEPKEREIKVKKLSEVQKEKKEKIEDYKDIIERAEQKIKEAQEEIKKVKDHGRISEHEKKIAEAKKKLIEDQKALMKLREDKD